MFKESHCVVWDDMMDLLDIIVPFWIPWMVFVTVLMLYDRMVIRDER